MKTAHHPYRLAFVLLLFMALQIACSLSGAKKEEATVAPKSMPTATFLPTRTPRPTLTLLPPPTDIPLSTDTPIVIDTLPPLPSPTAESASQATQAVGGIVDEIDTELQKYGYSTSQGYLGWAQTEATALKMDTYNEQKLFAVGDEQMFKDFVFQAEVTWESTTGLIVCGLFFRSEPDLERGAQYRFQMIRLSGAPWWDIELFDYNQSQVTVTGQVQSSQGIDQSNGAANTIMIIVENEQMTPIINGEEFKTRTNSKLTNGLLGFYGWQDSGKTTCTFENAWVWVLE